MTPAGPTLDSPTAVGRAERLARELDAGELGAALIVAASSRDPDLAAFVGPAHLGESFLLAPANAPPRLGYLTAMERAEAARTGLEILPPAELEVRRLSAEHGSGAAFWTALLERALGLAGIDPCRVALAGRFASGLLHEACRDLETRGWRFVSGDGALRRCRRSKTRWELERARAAAAGVCEAMRGVAAALAGAEISAGGLLADGRPLRSGDLRRVVAAIFAERDLEQPEGNIVAVGAEAAAPHTQGASSTRLAAGVPIVVDLYPRAGVFADCTRTFCRGEPSAAVIAAHETVRRAQRLALDGASVGSLGSDLQRAICSLFEEAGYATSRSAPGTETGYVHGLGHGVGHELHELPSFRENAGEDGVLAEGDLFTLEPGLYDEAEGFGIRLEDLCHLGSDGLEVLTPLPYDLDPRTWTDAR